MKKFFAVLLATVMLTSVFAVPAFAAIDLNTDNEGNSDYFVYLNGLVCWGSINFVPSTRVLNYSTNVQHLDIVDKEEELNFEIVYNLYAQCAINYADDSQDFDSTSGTCVVNLEWPGKVYNDITLSSGKTIVSFDGEFHVWSYHTMIWEGFIMHTYTPGINI